MRVVDTPALLPGACFLSHGHTGPFVDTLVDIEPGDGPARVYLAKSTVEDLGQMFGMLPATAAAARDETIARLHRDLADVTEDRDRQKAAVDALRAAGYEEVAVPRMPTPTELAHSEAVTQPVTDAPARKPRKRAAKKAPKAAATAKQAKKAS